MSLVKKIPFLKSCTKGVHIVGCSPFLSLFNSYLLHLYWGEGSPSGQSVWMDQRYSISSMKTFASNITAFHCEARDDDNVTKANLATLKVVWGDNHISVSGRRSSHVVCCRPRNHIKLSLLPPLFPKISKNISQVISPPCRLLSQLTFRGFLKLP